MVVYMQLGQRVVCGLSFKLGLQGHILFNLPIFYRLVCKQLFPEALDLSVRSHEHFSELDNTHLQVHIILKYVFDKMRHHIASRLVSTERRDGSRALEAASRTFQLFFHGSLPLQSTVHLDVSLAFLVCFFFDPIDLILQVPNRAFGALPPLDIGPSLLFACCQLCLQRCLLRFQ
jgi:hypothetical protein